MAWFVHNSTARQTKLLFSHRKQESMGMIGFDIACDSTEKRVENAELSRKRPLHTISANTKRTDFALAA